MRWAVFCGLLFCPLLPSTEAALDEHREKSVNETIEAANLTLFNPLVTAPLKDIVDLVGNHIKKDEERKSLFFLFRHCYHINIPGNSNWKEGYDYNLMISKNFLHIRRVHDKIQDIRDLIEECQTARAEAVRTELTLPTNESINRCVEKREELLAYITSKQFVLDVNLARLDALNIIIWTYIMSFWYTRHNGEDLEQKNRKLVLQKHVYLAPFPKMSQETYLLDIGIKWYRDASKWRAGNDPLPGARAYFAGVYKHTVELKLETEDYRHFSGLYNFGTDKERDAVIGQIRSQLGRFFGTWAKTYTEWRNDYSKFSETVFIDFKNKAEQIWNKNLRVELLNPEDPPHLYRWELVSGVDATLFNMTVAWDKMDEVSEHMKCFWDEDYNSPYIRPLVLKKAQMNLTDDAKIFTNTSYTLGEPCVVPFLSNHPFYSITGEEWCTQANHEICAPRPLSQFEDPDDLMRGGLSVLKPKWVFKKQATGSQDCIGHKTWVIQQYACRCGFRTDCGDDLGVNVSCPLQTNDWNGNRQCKGSVGYPCKTLPLATGKHQESCVTGYCDMDENSCEDGPWIARRAGSVMRRPETSSLLLIMLFTLMINTLN